jgi:hypothetical protein
MIRLTKHAREAISARDIAVDWIEAAISAPDWIEPDPRPPIASDPIKAIAERGGRLLRVVHRPEGDDSLIITVHFDRPGDDQNFL